jgi:hypothetical protein
LATSGKETEMPCGYGETVNRRIEFTDSAFIDAEALLDALTTFGASRSEMRLVDGALIVPFTVGWRDGFIKFTQTENGWVPEIDEGDLIALDRENEYGFRATLGTRYILAAGAIFAQSQGLTLRIETEGEVVKVYGE